MESNPKPPKATSAEINDMLTVEGMLMVVDRTTGKQTDIRSLMALTPEDIKDEKLREEVSKIPTLKEKAEEFAKAEVLDYDVSLNQDDKVSYSDNWSQWWEDKDEMNEKLKMAIITND